MKKLYLIGAFIFASSFLFAQETNTNKTLQTKHSAINVNKKSLSSDKQTISESEKAEKNLNLRKDNYIKLSDKLFRQQNNIPNDFPKYNDTGNLNQDIENYESKIMDWRGKNPGKYKEIKRAH